MKTVEQLIFEKRFKDAEFDPNDYNDWAKENEYEAYTLCLTIAKQLQQHLVMQAEASASVKGAAVGNSAAGQSGRVGCVHNTLNYIGPWYSCKDCGLHFNARAEVPPEGALPF